MTQNVSQLGVLMIQTRLKSSPQSLGTIQDSIYSSDPEKIAANPHSIGNRLVRVLWKVCCFVLYRPSPRVAHKFRVLLLRLFGAD